jgi:hypothetical protein
VTESQSSIEVEGLRIAQNLCLPLEAVTWVISYLAKRGAGKTYNAAVQAEEMLKAHIPIVVIDGMGIWWGLRVNADGNSPGLPVVVFGGEHADLPLIPENAAAVAKAVVESNISCVLDLSTFSKRASRKIVGAFLDELYRLNRVERHVFIEESDMFAPQHPIGEEQMLCLSSVDNFVRRGGNHNLGCTLITQRSAVLAKDVLTQSDCLVVLRTLAPQDKKAIQAWVEEQTDEDKTKLKEWYDSLKSLRNGEAWVWHPEPPLVHEKTMFRQRETFHATRQFILNPQASKIVLMSVDEFVERFKKVFKTASTQTSATMPSITDTASMKELEEFRSGHKLAESVQERLKFLGGRLEEISGQDAKLVDALEKAHSDLKKYDNFVKALTEILPTTNIQGPVNPGENSSTLVVTENIPTIHHKVERPIVETNESSHEGRLITLAFHGFFDSKKRSNAISAEITRVFAVQVNLSDLNKALGGLVQKKILQREEASNRGWEYWLYSGAKERIKEVEG